MQFRHTLLEEQILFQTLKESVVAEPEFDKFGGLNHEARDRAIKLHEALDKRKVERWKEVKKKIEDNKKKRLAAQVEKDQKKSKKKGMKRKVEIHVQEPAKSMANLKEGSSYFSLTQECLVHGLTLTVQNHKPVLDIDEYIFNLSLGILPGNTKAFDDILAFLSMVIFLP